MRNLLPASRSSYSPRAKSRRHHIVPSRDEVFRVLPTPYQLMVILATDIRAWAPPCPLLLKTVLAPAGFIPYVSPSYQAILSGHLPVLRENYCPPGHVPTTPVQYTAAVTSTVKFLAAAAQVTVALAVANHIAVAAALTEKLHPQPLHLDFYVQSELFGDGRPSSVA